MSVSRGASPREPVPQGWLPVQHLQDLRVRNLCSPLEYLTSVQHGIVWNSLRSCGPARASLKGSEIGSRPTQAAAWPANFSVRAKQASACCIQPLFCRDDHLGAEWWTEAAACSPSAVWHHSSPVAVLQQIGPHSLCHTYRDRQGARREGGGTKAWTPGADPDVPALAGYSQPYLLH